MYAWRDLKRCQHAALLFPVQVQCIPGRDVRDRIGTAAKCSRWPAAYNSLFPRIEARLSSPPHHLILSPARVPMDLFRASVESRRRKLLGFLNSLWKLV